MFTECVYSISLKLIDKSLKSLLAYVTKIQMVGWVWIIRKETCVKYLPLYSAFTCCILLRVISYRTLISAKISSLKTCPDII